LNNKFEKEDRKKDNMLILELYALLYDYNALTNFIMSSNEAFFIRKAFILPSRFLSILFSAAPPTTTGN
jgi:hypothetical protein